MVTESKKTSGMWKAAGALLACIGFGATMWPLHAPAQQPAPAAAPAVGTNAQPQNPTNTQSPPIPPQAANPIRAHVELVNVPLTAFNKQGMPVIDMNRDEFHVFEDGVEQKITHFESETSTPLRVGLILDTSNSARRQLSYEKDAATEFIYQVLRNGGTKNQIFLQTFDASSTLIKDFTNDPDVLHDRVDSLRSGGGKALYDAIYSACRDKMARSGQPEDVRRVLVVLSDGLDVQSQHTLDQAVSMARMTETMVYTVGTAAYGYDNPGDRLLDDLSTQTGGYPSYPLRETPGTDLETGYLSHGQIGDTSQNKGLGAETGRFSAERLVNIAQSLDLIGRNLDQQYTIGYKPLRDEMDGTYREIKVVTSRRGVTLRWKPGYFATTLANE